jgi:SAM-dependent methyltransferase
MTPSRGNRFEDFFSDDAYVSMKNILYNYLLRKRMIRKCMLKQEKGLLLEIGSGISPMVTDSDNVVYSDLSFTALRTMKSRHERGFFVTADAMHLPFKSGSFSRVVCSEVLEHLPEDRPALQQIATVLHPGGSLILTFPHRRDYFTRDDRYVNHFRRYELSEMEERLREAGLNPVEVQKVLGPMEKIIMVIVISAISSLQRVRRIRSDGRVPSRVWQVGVPVVKLLNRLFCLPMWLDAKIAPRFLSAVLLIRSVKL